MQLVKSINCTALCLDSSRLILVVWACPQGARGRGSFLPLQIHVSASKCGCQEAGEEGAAVAPDTGPLATSNLQNDLASSVCAEKVYVNQQKSFGET